MKKTTKQFPIEEMVLDPRCQARAGISNETVDEYADAYTEGRKLPAIEVFLVVGVPYVVDGFHRFAAQRKLGLTFIASEVVGSGSLDEAAWYATGVNTTNGLRRTNEDKRKAVRLALATPAGEDASNRTIAEHVGVSDKLVAEVRDQVRKVAPAGRSFDNPDDVADLAPPAANVGRIKGKDGKSYPARATTRYVKPETPREQEPDTDDQVRESAPDQESEVELDESTSAALPPERRHFIAGAGEIRQLRIRIMRALPDCGARQAFERGMRDAEGALAGATPEVCPYCNGKTCTRCNGRGWVARDQVTQFKATAARMAGAAE
jgi:hypothetical protein